MKSIRFSEVNGYNVIYGVSPVSIDPEETKAAISNALKISMDNVLSLDNLDHLIEQYAVYPRPGPKEYYVNDDEGSEKESGLATLGKHERLTLEGEIIPDWVGTKYHLKNGDTWTEAEIKAIGEALPVGAILPDDITAEQQAEIAAQKEAERIAALDPEAKEAEKQARLDALADEADRLSRRAQIQGAEFDAIAWYQEHKSSVEAKYL
jgi:hypothetical protein